jgi:hypothetical protein
MLFLPAITLLACLGPVFSGALAAAPDGNPELSVRFGDATIVLSGRVESKEASQNLAAAALSARPDLQIINEGLVIDATVELPPFSDLRSLIAELGLSTHEGRLEIWPDRVLIGGITDSVVTLTALRIRLEPIRGERRFINRLCIVETEYLPKIDVSLTSRVHGEPLTAIAPPGGREEAFELPGLLVEKLFPTLLMLSDFDRLEGKQSVPSGAALRAMPLEMTDAETGTGTGANGAMAPTLLATLPAAMPVQQYETMPSVHFSRNSFLLQANQEPIFEELIRYLLSPDRQGRAVLVEAVKTSGGSGAFNDYLCERRSAEVIRFLSERGVDATVMKTGVINSPSLIDEGEVRVKIEIPMLPPEPAAGADISDAAKGEPVSAPPSPKPDTAPAGLKPLRAE